MNSVSASPAVWTTTLQVRSYDVDMTRRATAQSLCRYFLDAAWSHAEALGVGFSHLAAHDRVWVLSRLLFRIRRQPDWGERISLETWPRGVQSVFALRDFEFRDSAGAVLASGTTGWLVISLKNRRPQRLDFLPASIPDSPGRRALEREPERLRGTVSAGGGILRTARPSDTDVNAHVTSARYLDWFLDTYPPDIHCRQQLESLEVNYLGETLPGDPLEVRSRETEPGLWFHSILKSDGAEVCRARLCWKTRTTALQVQSAARQVA